MIRFFRKIAYLALISFASVSAHAGSHSHEAAKEVLVILSSDSLQTQGMAMVLSNTMAKKGTKVNVLLCDKAGDMALKSYQAPSLKPKDMTPGQMLRGLLKQGGTAKVCALYLPNSKYKKADLIDGVGVAKPPEMAGKMLTMPTFTF